MMGGYEWGQPWYDGDGHVSFYRGAMATPRPRRRVREAARILARAVRHVALALRATLALAWMIAAPACVVCAVVAYHKGQIGTAAMFFAMAAYVRADCAASIARAYERADARARHADGASRKAVR